MAFALGNRQGRAAGRPQRSVPGGGGGAVIALLVFLVLAAFGGGKAQQAAAREARVVSVQVVPRGQVTCFDIVSVGRLAADVYMVGGPKRVVVDAAGAVFRLPRRPFRPRERVVRGFRYGVLETGLARIVVDVANEAELVGAEIDNVVPGTFRLSVALRHGPGTGPGLKRPDKTVDPTICRPEPNEQGTIGGWGAPQVTASRRPAAQEFVVVIDPGHGGADPGAVVNRVHLEKVVVLAVAKEVARRLRARPGIRVVLTRDQDRFVSLDDRVARSRAEKADVFISLHADSVDEVPQPDLIRGAAVYILSDKASNAEARRLADKENAADLLGGLLPKAVPDEPSVRNILLDLLRRETHDQSVRLRTLLLKSMRNGTVVTRDPARSAAFVVLKQAQTPAALIELGYMTNPRDLALMRRVDWQRRVADRIAEAIEQYLRTK